MAIDHDAVVLDRLGTTRLDGGEMLEVQVRDVSQGCPGHVTRGIRELLFDVDAELAQRLLCLRA